MAAYIVAILHAILYAYIVTVYFAFDEILLENFTTTTMLGLVTQK